MTDSTHIDIDAVEARVGELTDEHADAWHVHNGAISGIAYDASLRGADGDPYGMDARRGKAVELTRDALADQERITDELVEAAGDALRWADSVLDAGDFSDGLDELDRESLTRVMDRAVIRNDGKRALAAAQLLDADGDHTAMPRLASSGVEGADDVRVALEYVNAYGDPAAILGSQAIVTSAVRLPDDGRLKPSVEVAQTLRREEAERRAAEEAAALEARVQLRAELNPTPRGRVVSDEARSRRAAQRRRAPYGYGG